MIDFDFFQELYQSVAKNKLRTILAGFTVAFAILLLGLILRPASNIMNIIAKAESKGKAVIKIFLSIKNETAKPKIRSQSMSGIFVFLNITEPV